MTFPVAGLFYRIHLDQFSKEYTDFIIYFGITCPSNFMKYVNTIFRLLSSLLFLLLMTRSFQIISVEPCMTFQMIVV